MDFGLNSGINADLEWSEFGVNSSESLYGTGIAVVQDDQEIRLTYLITKQDQTLARRRDLVLI